MKHPNIVLFLAEDLDFEGLNCYNAEATGYTGLIRAQNPFAAVTPPVIFSMASSVLQALKFSIFSRFNTKS